MARLFGFIFLLVLIVAGISFAVLNSGTVSLNYYFGVVDTPVSLVVVVALSAGALMGVLATAGAVVRLRHRVRKLQKQLETARRKAGIPDVLPARE